MEAGNVHMVGTLGLCHQHTLTEQETACWWVAELCICQQITVCTLHTSLLHPGSGVVKVINPLFLRQVGVSIFMQSDLRFSRANIIGDCKQRRKKWMLGKVSGPA